MHVFNNKYVPMPLGSSIYVAFFYMSENETGKPFLVHAFQTIILYLVRNLTYGNAYHIHHGFDP